MKPGTAIPEGMKPAGRQVMISCVSGTINIRTGNGTQYSRITAAKNGDTFAWVATAENGWHARSWSTAAWAECPASTAKHNNPFTLAVGFG